MRSSGARELNQPVVGVPCGATLRFKEHHRDAEGAKKSQSSLAYETSIKASHLRISSSGPVPNRRYCVRL
ncbi:hypothetical protein VTK26DRAFT_776 [Humicola hyalothermophila]